MWVRYLQKPAAWRELGVWCDQVEMIETHRAWVLLAGDRVLKLKKPCRETFLDFSTPARRAWACREELRLNRRLAPGVYLGLVALRHGVHGPRLERDPTPASGTETREWAVLMRRLHADAMLDHRLAEGPPLAAETVAALAVVLARFWAATPIAAVDPTAYLAGFAAERRRDADVLLKPALGVSVQAGRLLPRFDQALAQASPALGQRVAGGHIRDGHGDLRPEHIALTDPPVVIDALEFNAALRAQDPYDELAFLDLECARLGAPGLGPALIQGVSAALGERPPHHLLRLYRAHRALLRARLALAHLLEDPVRHPDRWPPRAAGYLQQAEQALDTLEDTGTAA